MPHPSNPTSLVRSSAFCWWAMRLLTCCDVGQRQEALHVADAISRHVDLALTQECPIEHLFDVGALRWKAANWLCAETLLPLLQTFIETAIPTLRRMAVPSTMKAEVAWTSQRHTTTEEAWRWSQQHTQSLWRIPGLTERAASLVMQFGPRSTTPRSLCLHTYQPADQASQGQRLLLALELVSTWPCWDVLQADAWFARVHSDPSTWVERAAVRRRLRSRGERWVHPIHALEASRADRRSAEHLEPVHDELVAWIAAWHAEMPKRGASLEAWWHWTSSAAARLGCAWPALPPPSCRSGQVDNLALWQRFVRTLLQQTCVVGNLQYGPADAPCTHWVDARLGWQDVQRATPVEVWGVLDTHHRGWDPLPLLGGQHLAGLPLTDSWRACLKQLARSHAWHAGDLDMPGHCLVAIRDQDSTKLTPRQVWQSCFNASHAAVEAVETTSPAQATSLTSTSAYQAPLRCPPERMQGTWSVSALALFSQCSFAGVVHHVLGLRKQRRPHVGLDAAEWGECVHQLLEAFWTRYPDHASLVALQASSHYHASVMEVVVGVVKRWRGRKPLTWGDVARPLAKYPTVVAAQARLQDHLHQLLLSWLALEAQREPFEVEALEVNSTWSHGAMSWQGRLDRVDRLTSGERVVWDIKTGPVALRQMLPPEVASPQLPAYALAYPDLPAAVGYALIQVPNMRFQVLGSVAADACAASNQGGHRAPDAWAELLATWRKVLMERTEAWWSGHAPLNPMDGEATCERCSVRSVCRRDDPGTTRTCSDALPACHPVPDQTKVAAP